MDRLDNTESRDLRVQQILKELGNEEGPEGPQGFVAASAAALSNAIGVVVPDAGAGTYLAACMGVKPSAGFSVSVESASLERNHVTVQLALQEPGPDDLTAAVLIAPFAVAIIQDLDPKEKNFSFVAKLNWRATPVGV